MRKKNTKAKMVAVDKDNKRPPIEIYVVLDNFGDVDTNYHPFSSYAEIEQYFQEEDGDFDSMVAVYSLARTGKFEKTVRFIQVDKS